MKLISTRKFRDINSTGIDDKEFIISMKYIPSAGDTKSKRSKIHPYIIETGETLLKNYFSCKISALTYISKFFGFDEFPVTRLM